MTASRCFTFEAPTTSTLEPCRFPTTRPRSTAATASCWCWIRRWRRPGSTARRGCSRGTVADPPRMRKFARIASPPPCWPQPSDSRPRTWRSSTKAPSRTFSGRRSAVRSRTPNLGRGTKPPRSRGSSRFATRPSEDRASRARKFLISARTISATTTSCCWTSRTRCSCGAASGRTRTSGGRRGRWRRRTWRRAPNATEGTRSVR
mmetsp:Transcript_317/g.1247  ORF Transcript_317/g.1247 Transcript_317/m.1247 type:complete len:205 (+) Transcript_317:1724-2338(+)